MPAPLLEELPLHHTSTRFLIFQIPPSQAGGVRTMLYKVNDNMNDKITGVTKVTQIGQ